MALLDLLGRRWALCVIWELREGPVGFRELQARCDGMPPSVLSTRLAELRGAGAVGKDAEGNYSLTEGGRSLLEALDTLRGWARRWAERVAAETEDAERGSQR